jgi:TonB family protein
MEINFRRAGVVLVLANIGALLLVPDNVVAQAGAKDQEIKGQVVLSKLYPPVYPPLAREALVFGDVHLKVSVHPDGNTDSIAVLDGPPMLQQAALDSARQSQFECKDCAGSSLSRSFTYSFRFPQEGQQNPDPCCCSHEPGSPGYKAHGATVSQSDETITVTTPPVCSCPDACDVKWAEQHSHFRSPKCLYLWKCGHRTIYID